jgi:hypothetical protein
MFEILSLVKIAPMIGALGSALSPLPASYLNSSRVSGVYVKIIKALANRVRPRQSFLDDNTI